MAELHFVRPENAQQFWDWLQTRGGLAIWRSVNLSNPGASWTCPVNDSEGNRVTKPNWQCGNEPERLITDPAEVAVSQPREVKRFHVAVRQGGMMLKLTAGASRKVWAAVAKSGTQAAPAWYAFDYETQEAVIFVDDGSIPLADYISKLEKPDAAADAESPAS